MKKSSPLLLTILLYVSLLSTGLCFSQGQTGTNVTGIIYSDTTWTPAGSPYILQGNVLIEKSVKLTIQPGTTVNLGDYTLKVNGTLQAVGTAALPVFFNEGILDLTKYSSAWNPETVGGCIIKNAVVNSTITTEGSTLIQSNIVTGLLQVGNMQQNAVGTAIIKNNIIRGQGILLHSSDNVIIEGNTISGCSNSGITTGTLPQTESILIQNNLIVNNTRGIEIWMNTPIAYNHHYLISGNTITNNTFGVTLTENWAPVVLKAELSNNNIYNNSMYNLDLGYNSGLGLPNDINAVNNYWGTNSEQETSQKIYDYYDNYDLSKINFTPQLYAPNTQAPTGIIVQPAKHGVITPSGVIRLNYGDSQTFTFSPDTGYHLSDVRVNGTSVGNATQYTIVNIQGVTLLEASFALNTPTPTPTPTSNPNSTQPTPTPIPTQTPISNKNPTLTLLCKSSTSQTMFNIKINGQLSADGVTISNAPIILSYRTFENASWQTLASATTDSTGMFSVEWHPLVNGTYIVNATYPGNEYYSKTSSIITLIVMPFQVGNSTDVLSMTSNSTIIGFDLNLDERKISFEVSGLAGTNGFVDVYIAKSLLTDTANLEIYLGENKVAYAATEQTDCWFIHFTYHHSSHKVIMNLHVETSELRSQTPLQYAVFVVIVLTLSIVALALIWKRKRLVQN